MVSFVGRNSGWGTAELSTMGIGLSIGAFILKKHFKGFQTRPSYEKIAEAPIVPRHSGRPSFLVASSPSSATPAICYKILTHSSDVVFVGVSCLVGFELFFPQDNGFATVQHGDPGTHTCTHSSLSHEHALSQVPSATQQDLIANPHQSQSFASLHPKLPIHPTPSPDVVLA